MGSEEMTKKRKYLIFEQYRIRFFRCHRSSCDIWTQNTQNKSGLRLTYSFFFFPHLLYVITKNHQWARKSKLYSTFEAEIIILEIKFYKGAKRLRGERGSGRNDSGANGKVGETTRGRNDSGRKGKWAKRLGGERESGRNDPDSAKMTDFFCCSQRLKSIANNRIDANLMIKQYTVFRYFHQLSKNIGSNTFIRIYSSHFAQ